MIQGCTIYYTLIVLILGFDTKNEQVIHKLWSGA